jgi:hypothetical protein
MTSPVVSEATMRAACTPLAIARVIWPSLRKTRARNVAAPGIMMSAAGTDKTIRGDLMPRFR